MGYILWGWKKPEWPEQSDCFPGTTAFRFEILSSIQHICRQHRLISNHPLLSSCTLQSKQIQYTCEVRSVPASNPNRFPVVFAMRVTVAAPPVLLPAQPILVDPFQSIEICSIVCCYYCFINVLSPWSASTASLLCIWIDGFGQYLFVGEEDSTLSRCVYCVYFFVSIW